MDAITVFMVVSPLIALAAYVVASAFAANRAGRRIEESNRRNGLDR